MNEFKMRNSLILEDLNDFKRQQFPEMSLRNLMTFARFSPDWDDGMERCKLNFEYDPNDQKFSQFLDALNNMSSELKYSLTFVGDPSQQSKVLNLEWPQAQFGKFMKATKSRKLQFRPEERNGDNMKLAGDLLTLKNVYLVWKALKSDVDVSKLQLLGDGDELEAQDKEDFTSRLEAKKQKLQVKCRDIDNAIAIFGLLELEEDGDFDLVLEKVFNNGEDEVQVLGKDGSKRFYQSIEILENMSEKTKTIISIGYNEAIKQKKGFDKVLKEFKDFKIASNIHKYKLRVAAKAKVIADKEKDQAKKDNLSKPEKERKSDDELDEIVRQKVNKTCEQSLKGMTSIKTLAELKSYLEPQSNKGGPESDKKLLSTRPDPTNPCAKRRMKLFDDLVQFKGKVFQNDEFVIGLTYTRKQNHIFGRYKPICVAGSTTEIDENCNSLSAKGIYQKLRDHKTTLDDSGNNRSPVKDDTGNSYIYESTWCTTGCDRFSGTGASSWDNKNQYGYWSNYNNDSEEVPYTIIMEISNGRMYQYAGAHRDKMFLFEDEFKDNINDWYRNHLDYRANMKRFRDSYPTLDAMMTKVVDPEYAQFSGSSSQIDAAIRYASARNLITDNNRVIIRNRTDAEVLYTVFDQFDGIVIRAQDATELFREIEFSGDIPPIDCSSVVVASRMFFKARSAENITLKNTGGIESMKQMFYECRIPGIYGLDTSSAKTIEGIFEHSTSNLITRPISIPDLNLKSCKDADRAFLHCSAKKITLSNTGSIETIADAFVDCYALKFFPQFVKRGKDGKIEKAFPKIDQSIVRLTMNNSFTNIDSVKEDDVSMLFDGCSTLHALPEFKEKCKEIYDLYFTNRGEEEKEQNTEQVDDRGYLIVKSREDVVSKAKDFHRYPGVVVDSEDATQMFAEIESPLRIPTLDVSKVRIATKMFAESTIARLEKFIGLENVQTASKMFYHCKCNRYPELNFSGLTGKFDVFFEAYPSREEKLPKVILGSGIDLQMPNESQIRADYPNETDEEINNRIRNQANNILRFLLGLHYGNQYGITAWNQTHLDYRLGEWYLNLGKMTNEAYIKRAKQLEKTKEGYTKFPSASFFRRYVGEDLQQAQEAVNKLQGIYIDTLDASGFFKEMSLTLPPINMEKVKIANSMFYGFRGTITQLKNCDSIVSSSSMFRKAQLPEIPVLQTNKIEIAPFMFAECRINGEYPEQMLDFRSLVDGESMFFEAKFRNQIDFDHMRIDSIENGTSMFKRASVKVTNISLPNCKDCRHMFEEAKLTILSGTIKEINLPLAEDCRSFMYGSYLQESEFTLQKIGKFSAPKATNVQTLFGSQKKLQYIGSLNIKMAREAAYAFMDCEKLKCIMPIQTEFPRGTNFDSRKMFKNCPLHVVYGNNAEKIKAKNAALGRY